MSGQDLFLVTIPVAAQIAERSHKTIRRWIKDGKLTRHYGVSANGGTAPILVDQNDLLRCLTEGGQQPKNRATRPPPDPPPSTAGELGELEHLRGQLLQAESAVELVRSEGRVIALEVELSGVRERLEDLERQLHGAKSREESLRLEVNDWKDRHDAKEAELNALRSAVGLPWWRRLLPMKEG